jgi:hypothetical protein
MKKRAHLFPIILFAVILAVSAWGQAKQTNKTAAKPMTPQASAAANQTLTSVRGHIKYKFGNKAVEGVEVTLSGVPYTWERSAKTDSTGSYSFGNLADKIGQTLKISAGSGWGEIYYDPHEISFVLAGGFNTIKDIIFNPPPINVAARFAAPDGAVIPNVEFMLFYVLNSQDIAIDTKKTDSHGFCSFEIAHVNIGKEFVLKPNDPKYKSFSPVEKRFKLSGASNTFYFVNTGPLPDLVAADTAQWNGGMVEQYSFVVTNQGNAPSGPCPFYFSYMQTDVYGRIQVSARDATMSIPALAPGASFSFVGMTRSYPDWSLNLLEYIVDYGNVVGESNGNNNSWRRH